MKIIHAAFKDGSTISRKTKNEYTHAWRVTGTWNNKPTEVSGFSSDFRKAQKAANRFAAVAGCWINPVVEIVTVF